MTTFRINWIAFQMRHFHILQIHTGTAHKDVLLQSGLSNEEFRQWYHIRFLASIHIVHIIVLRWINQCLECFGIFPITLEENGRCHAVLKRFRRFAGDGSWSCLATIVHSDTMTTLVQFFPQPIATETCPTNHQYFVRSNTRQQGRG